MSPKVSVCIASYNHARFLPETLESILAQTYRDFEIIVADDGSTDGSYDLLMSYASQHPARIKVVTHPSHVNRGISATVNLALQHAAGTYIGWLGSDDVWYPHLLEKGVAVLEADARLGLVYGKCDKVYENGNERISRITGEDFTQEERPWETLINDCVISSCAVVFRKECFTQLGPFVDSLVCSDWDFYIKLAAHWPLAYIPESLAMYRLHGANTTAANNRVTNERLLALADSLRYNAETIGGALALRRTQAVLELRRASLCYRMGDEIAAAQSVARAWAKEESLAHDYTFLLCWLVNWGGGSEFAVWFLTRMPETVTADKTAKLRKDVLNTLSLQAASRHQQAGETLQSRQLALSTVARDLSWRQLRKAAPFLIRSFTGEGHWRKFQELKRRFTNSL